MTRLGDSLDVTSIVQRLRDAGSDASDIEAKSALGGFPISVTRSICALANRPGGGLLLLGLDENDGFRPVELADPAELCASLAKRARTAFEPPVLIDVDQVTFEGRQIVVAQITETQASSKPCRLAGSHEAYLRFWDGDFRLSEQEVQGFIANRTQPQFDTQPVSGATIDDDLDSEHVRAYLDAVRRSSATLRTFADGIVLQKTGVITDDGAPTLAGILALGVYPQQWLPSYSIQAAVLPGRNDPAEIRAHDPMRIDGPIPVMLDTALNWIRRNVRRSLINSPDGNVTERHEISLVAARELIANALVHRDLAPWSRGYAIELRLKDDEMVLVNPGGLFGVSLERLGQRQLSSARNSTLLRICQYLSTSDHKVVEALATGIPTAVAATLANGAPPPRFIDDGIRFTVRVKRASATPEPRPATPAVSDERLTPTGRDVLAALTTAMDVHDLVAATDLSVYGVRRALQRLQRLGFVERDGGPGDRRTSYRRTSTGTAALTSR